MHMNLLFTLFLSIKAMQRKVKEAEFVMRKMKVKLYSLGEYEHVNY